MHKVGYLIELNPMAVYKFSGDARFISVEYRLFKLPSDAKQETVELMYNGEITGFEEELKVCMLLLFHCITCRLTKYIFDT